MAEGRRLRHRAVTVSPVHGDPDHREAHQPEPDPEVEVPRANLQPVAVRFWEVLDEVLKLLWSWFFGMMLSLGLCIVIHFFLEFSSGGLMHAFASNSAAVGGPPRVRAAAGLTDHPPSPPPLAWRPP